MWGEIDRAGAYEILQSSVPGTLFSWDTTAFRDGLALLVSICDNKALFLFTAKRGGCVTHDMRTLNMFSIVPIMSHDGKKLP